jgi:hypothetical protein
MTAVQELPGEARLAELFATRSVGYLTGRITIGRSVLGGIAGTSIMGVAATLVPQVITFDFRCDNFTKRPCG